MESDYLSIWKIWKNIRSFGSLFYNRRDGKVRWMLGIKCLLGRFPRALCPAAPATRKARVDASRVPRGTGISNAIILGLAFDPQREYTW